MCGKSTNRANAKHHIVNHLVCDAPAWDARFQDAMSQIRTPTLRPTPDLLVSLMQLPDSRYRRSGYWVVVLSPRRANLLFPRKCAWSWVEYYLGTNG